MGFLGFQPCFGHALNHCQCSKTYPKLSKSVKRQLAWGTLKYHQKLRFMCFLQKKLYMCRGVTKACSYHSNFRYNFFHMSFLLFKNGLCMWISACPFVQNDVFLKVPFVLWVWDFVDMYLTHPRTRMWRDSFHMYSKKWFSWVLKHWCPP
jgi:hypothetical protein